MTISSARPMISSNALEPLRVRVRSKGAKGIMMRGQRCLSNASIIKITVNFANQ